MIAKVCDRCGKVFAALGDRSEQLTIFLPPKYNIGSFEMYEGTNRVDICPDCIDSFGKWVGEYGKLKMEKEDEND